CARDQSNLDVW
nr:immunoglobulin heavy chain junction region [Macaca mulatta]